MMSTAFKCQAVNDDDEFDNFVPCKKETQTETTTDTRTAITAVYELEKCVSWITENCLSKIALQFPDKQLKDAVPVLKCLQPMLPIGVSCFVLGDTSYGSCCVDEVAAEHYNADGIIHFGSACLSPTQRLSVLYCFCPQPVSVDHVVGQLQTVLPDRSTMLIVMSDTAYQHAVELVASELKSLYSTVVTSSLQADGVSKSEPLNTVNNDSGGTQNICTYCKCHRLFSLPESRSVEEFTVLYLGEEGPALTNLMMTLNKCSFVTYDPEKQTARRETLNVSRELMKRYYMIERAKDANIVGIVAGTLGMSRTTEMIAHLKKLVKDAGKKSYTLAVGKLNVAKLANFMEVDVFVLVACPQNSLICSKDFVKPVVTPYEMEIACNQARQWSGDYVTDFMQLLPGAAEYVPAVPAVQDTVDVSLVTNKLRSLGHRTEVVRSSAVMLRSDALAVSTVGEGAKNAAEYLSSRTWKGLESGEKEATPIAILKQGRIGLPTQYCDEPMRDEIHDQCSCNKSE